VRRLFGGAGEFRSPGNGEFPEYRKFGEMTTVPGRVGRRVTYGLAAVIAAVSVVLAGQPPVGAVTGGRSRNTQHATKTRNIQHERYIRHIGKTGDASGARTKPRAGKSPQAAQPRAIAVPSIGLAADLMPLGGPDGGSGPEGLSLPVPPLARAASDAGWYQFTSVPGTAGNAVIVGHVDTFIGPAVFYNLYQLRPGDAIYVVTGGTRQRFDVTSVRELPKPSFPVNQVFGSTERHMLWLITCGGAFDSETGHYMDNIVVSATWAPPVEKHLGPRKKAHEKRS
jgi:LPXTG-site transpeptidase (sortase) family protein